MLAEIHVQNYALIDAVAVEFSPGLNLLSGETGSGKSILVDALGLALGGRASPEVIRTGTDRAAVTAVFRAAPAPWAAWLDQHGLNNGESNGEELILRREVQSGGRSRMLVNDQPVTLAAVRDLAGMLVEIHGQGEQAALYSREAQLEILDEFAADGSSLEEVGALFAARRALEKELEGLLRNEQDRLRRIDLLRFQVHELEGAKLEPGEDSRLAGERQVLANLEKVRGAAAAAYASIYDDEGSALARIAAASRALEELGRYDDRAEPHRESLAGARAALEDVAEFLRGYAGKLEADPGRLEQVEDRLALIERLKRKYGATIEEMLAHQVGAAQELEHLEHADERAEELQATLERAANEYWKAALALSKARRAAARQFEKRVLAELAQLGMEKTRFEVHFDDRPAVGAAAPEPSGALPGLAGGPRGIDAVEFLISPNPGEELRPLEKVASGGEVSRFMLALKTVAGQAEFAGARGRAPGRRPGRPEPTFIFDEVDVGIGGRIAEYVGQRLKRLARDAQVLCVTHLPQIACFADHHFYVEKVERGGRTVTTVRHLETQKDRVAELARMLSGSQITDAVLKHAAAMLKQSA